MLAQSVMAEGLVRGSAASVRPVVEFCLRNDLNIFQMPCPETLCMAGGLGRPPRGKAWYEANGLRETARAIAQGQADYMARLRDGGIEIVAVIGVEFSPACGVNYLNKGRTIVRDQGIYVEELKAALFARNLDPMFVGVNARWTKKLERDLAALLQPPATQASLFEEVQLPGG